MNFLAFILGLSLGIGLWLWKQRHLNRQLGRMLNSLPNRTVGEVSLPTISRLRLEISQANQQRQRLEGELQIWQQLLESAPVGYLQVDEENQLLWCNQQARQLLKLDRWQPGQVRLLLELVRSYELDQLIEQTRLFQNPQVIEWVFHTTSHNLEKTAGVTRSLSMRAAHSLTLQASSLPLSEGGVGVFLENQQPLIELSQARDRLVSDLTHELRTPLTSIRLVAEALQSRLQPPESRWADRMLQETNRLIDLVEDCVEVSRLEKNPNQHLNRQSIELRNLIFSVWQTLEPLAKQKDLRIAYSGSDRLNLQADESRLTQVFLNLFDNSIKHSRPQTAIRVEVNTHPSQDATQSRGKETSSPPTYVQVSIIDSGSGFSKSDLPYVFERLYRGDASRQRHADDSEPPESLPVARGKGLGLSIVQQIIQAHGGSIQAKNHPETGGAWLQIKLPLSSKN